MEVKCKQCDVSFAYTDIRPRFCQHCGVRLDYSSNAEVIDSLNLPTMQVDTSTIAPRGIQPAEEPLDDRHPDVGLQIHQYRLVRPLGSGGMGVVWEAVENQTGRRVALKRLSKQMVAEDSFVKRFLREAKLAAQISHPKVTFIYGAGEFEGQPYIVMELMPGRTLADEIEEDGPFEIVRAVDASLDAIDGLIASHRMGVIHRDVKPSNCFLDIDKSVKIGDFGLSKSMEGIDIDLTQTGTFMGTPSYSAPEQVRGEKLDGRTDIYALGGTLYCLLTGQPPFVGDAMSVTAQIVSDAPIAPRKLNSKIPPDLEKIILRCLEKEPSRRFESLEELRIALLPFASYGTSLSNFGRRMAAYMTDFVMLQMVFVMISVVVGLVVGVAKFNDPGFISGPLKNLQVGFSVMTWLAMVSYFAVFEGIKGRTLGKMMMGLVVVNSQGERPGFWAALLRAFAIPGCFGITLIFGVYTAVNTRLLLDTASLLVDAGKQIIVLLVPTFICLSTMSVANRLRGLHGIISGTRVIRLSQGGVGQVQIPIVETQFNTINMQMFGPYETRDMLGHSANWSFYLGKDPQLDREVWIVSRETEEGPTPERIKLTRTARPRWLGGGIQEGSRWDVYEAIHGAPIQILTGVKYKLGWEEYREALFELAVELDRAIVDETLPDQLSLAQVWIEQDGSVRLIDRPLVSVVVDDFQYEAVDQNDSTDDYYRAVHLLQSFADLLLRTKTLPVSAIDFLTELSQHRLREQETLHWSIEQLRSLRQNMAELHWDSRIGIMGVTIGLEGVIYGMLSLAVYTVLLFWSPVSISWSFATGFLSSLVLPMVMGFWMRGPIFRFMDIDICHQQGGQASRMICALRNALAWGPLMIVTGAMTAFSGAGLARIKDELVEGSFAYALHNSPVLAGGIFAVAVAAMVLIVAGVVVAIRNPERGIQDFVSCTRLLPR